MYRKKLTDAARSVIGAAALESNTSLLKRLVPSDHFAKKQAWTQRRI